MASLEKYEDESNQPFLDASRQSEDRNSDHCVCPDQIHRSRSQRRATLLLWSISCNIFLIILFLTTILGLSHFVKPKQASEQDLFPSSIGSLQYETKLLGSPFKNNSFVGEPGPEVDEAWRELLRNAQVKITAEELAQTQQQSSIPLADGSGYVAELGVYHYLHCLKMIKQNLHLDHYHPEYNEYDHYRQRFHIDHCIEFLREALMCNADTSIMTFRWVEQFPIPVSNLWSKHQCVKWDMVENWADNRRVNLSEPGIIDPKPEFNANVERK